MVEQTHPGTPISLPEGGERLLHWLARYPFQRAQDLVLALAPWEKRTTVYKHLAALEHLHLVEILHAGMAPRKRLYHLSPLGKYVCDHLAWQNHPENQEKRAQWERWEQRGIGPVVQEEREKLVRLLPRLPIFLLLQNAVNSLVANVSAALTNQGRHARIIQWSWLRDYAHPFASAREQIFHLRVDGALALCLRFTQAEVPAEGLHPRVEFAENWYSLLLLHCPFNDVRLMHARLDRLLRWRESAERTAVYSQMPPLLILATTERQAEWWHLAATQVASRLRLDPPLGAVACLPPAEEEWPDLWHVAFRRIGSRELCHVQDLLRQGPAPAVPALLAWRGEASEYLYRRKEHEAQLVVPPRLRLRSYTVKERPGKARSASSSPQQSGQTARDYRLASVSLTPRHWEILHLCFAHPLLSRENITHLLVLSRTTINLLLADLERAGYLGSVETLVGARWQLTEAGLRLLARLAFCHVHRLVRFPLEEEQPLVQRGVPGLLHQIRHTAGVYAFFAQLSQALATLPHARLGWWETGVSCERHFLYQEKIYRFRPDALASVQLGERVFRFWLEWDRGTMTPKDLRRKFATYAMYLASREWAGSSPYLPAILCVTPESAQEHRLTRAVLQYLVQGPAALCVYTTTASLLTVRGILEPIWQVALPRKLPQQAPPDAWHRVALFASAPL